MPGWAIPILLTFTLPVQAEPPVPQPASKAEIRDAVTRLGAPQFAVRRQASTFLWQQGLAAQAALEEAARSVDREVRLRAETILSDFRYGILPGVPADIVGLLRKYRDDPPTRLAMFRQLARRGRFEELRRLARMEEDPQQRRALLASMIAEDNAVEHFLEIKLLEAFVQAVGEDQPATWQRSLVAQLVFSEKMIQRLLDQGRLETLVEVVQREPSADARREMLSMLFSNQATVAALVAKDQLDFLLNLIAREPDADVRASWVNLLLGGSETVRALAEDESLERVLAFAGEHLEDTQRKELLEKLFQNYTIVGALLEERGLEPLIKMASAVKDPGARGRTLAALVGSHAIRQALSPQLQVEWMMKVAQAEKDPTARGQFLKVLIKSSGIYMLLQDTECRRTLWTMVKSTKAGDEDDASWRGDAVYRILSYSSPEDVLKEQEETAWLLGFLKEGATAEQRVQIMTRLLSDYRMQKLLAEHDRVDALLSLIREQPPQDRGRLLQRFAGSRDLIQKMIGKEEVGRLIELAAGESDAEARVPFLCGLFRNSTAMSQLLKDDGYDRLWALVMDERDPVRHARLRGDFVSTSDVIQILQQKKQLTSLIDFARESDNPDARRTYLEKLSGNSYALNALIDDGQFDPLYALVEGEPDEASRRSMLSRFYVNSEVVEQMVQRDQVAVLLDFAEAELGGNALYNYLRQLTYNDALIQAAAKQDQVEKMVSLVCENTNRYYRESLLRTLLSKPQVVEHYIRRDRLEALFAAVAGEQDSLRQQVMSALLGRSETVQVLVEEDQVEKLTELIREEPNASRRGSFLGQLMVQSPVVEQLVAEDRTEQLLDLARNEEESAVRTSYLSRLFASTAAVAAVIEHCSFAELEKLAAAGADDRSRTDLRAALLSNSESVQYLIRQNQVDRLLELVTAQTDSSVQQRVLTRLTQSDAAVNALIDNGQFDQLLDLCHDSGNAAIERRMLTALLNSSRVVEQLAGAKRLDSIVESVLGQADRNARQQAVRGWLTQPQTLNALLEHGQFDRLYDVVSTEENSSRRDQYLRYLLTNPRAIRYLADRERVPWLLDHYRDGMHSRYVAQHLRAILQQPEAVEAIASAGCLDDLLQLTEDKLSDSDRDNTLRYIVYNTATLVTLAKHGQVAPLLDQLKEHADADLRRQFLQNLAHSEEGRKVLADARLGEALLAMLQDDRENPATQSLIDSLLSNSSFRQALVESGQSDVLLEIAKLEADLPQRKSRLQEILYSPSGLVSHHLQRAEWEEVERLLESAADNDLGRLRLATYLLVMDRLDPRIASLREQVQQAADPGDTRLLVYLLRARGELSEARTVAESLGDPGLLKAISVEGGWWSDAARLQAGDPCPLPIPPREKPAEDERHRRVEQLGLVAAYQRLAGDTAQARQTLDQLRELAAEQADDSQLTWYALEALLLNDEVAQGLRLAAETHPKRAFEWHLYRHEYAQAFALFGLDDPRPLDAEWLQALPASSEQSSEQHRERCLLAIAIARSLYRSGQRERAIEVIDLLEEQVKELPDSSSSSSPRKWSRQQIASALVLMNDFPRACEIGIRGLRDSSDAASLLPVLFPERRYAAQVWWRLLRAEAGSEPAQQTLQRVAREMEVPGDAADDPFERLSERAERSLAELPEPQRRQVALWMCEASLARGRSDDALRFLGEIQDDKGPAEVRARVLWQAERWEQAAEAWYAVWEEDHEQLTGLYLSGIALVRGGNQQAGSERVQLAHRSALDSRARIQMALQLMQYGLRKEAFEQCRIVLRTAPFEYWEWHEAARRLGESEASGEAAQVVRWLEWATLDDLRTYFYLLNDADYLRARTNVHHWRARAAVQSGDPERAAREIELALAATPGESRLGEYLVPLLAENGWEDAADSLFETLVGNYRGWLEAYPRSALLLNNLAWMSARAGRRLDAAFEEAQEAVALEPDSAAYLDTLAEVHFRRGDRETAVRHSRRAVCLRPGDATLREQLARFQTEALP